jgi:hypothetical protein
VYALRDASNLVIYLTEKLHQDTVEAPNNVTNWSGTGRLPLVLSHKLVDTVFL